MFEGISGSANFGNLGPAMHRGYLPDLPAALLNPASFEQQLSQQAALDQVPPGWPSGISSLAALLPLSQPGYPSLGHSGHSHLPGTANMLPSLSQVHCPLL